MEINVLMLGIPVAAPMDSPFTDASMAAIA